MLSEEQALKNFNFVMKRLDNLAKAKGRKIVTDVYEDNGEKYVNVTVMTTDNVIDINFGKRHLKSNQGYDALVVVEFLLEDLPFIVNKRKTFIYGLYDPREPEVIRYVGKSDDPQIRLSQHVSKSRNLLDPENKLVEDLSSIGIVPQFDPKDRWIDDLLKNGLSPGTKILEEVDYEYDCEWGDKERYYINLFLKQSKLTNKAKGGPSYKGKGYTEYNERLDIWRKSPAPENEENLRRVAELRTKLRIEMIGGKICSYCRAYIPSPVPDSWAQDRRAFHDILPYKPLLNTPSLWPEEEAKHTEGCVWWKTGMIGAFPPAGTEINPDLRCLEEMRVAKQESFLYFKP